MHPVVDAGHGHGVEIGRRDAGGGEGLRAGATAGAAVQPERAAEQTAGEGRAETDPDRGAEEAGLRGEHEEERDADEGDEDAGAGEHPGDGEHGSRRRPGLCGRHERRGH